MMMKKGKRKRRRIQIISQTQIRRMKQMKRIMYVFFLKSNIL